MEKSPSVAQVLARVSANLRRADLAVLAAKERPLRAIGTSNSLYAVLMNLGLEPGQTSAELARAVGVTPQAVHPLVTKLVERGWVERRVHVRHAGVQELHLTEDGVREAARADRVVEHLDGHLRAGLGEGDYALLAELLAKVSAQVQSWVPPGDQ